MIHHADLGSYHCYFEGDPGLLFSDNDTNLLHLYNQKTAGYFKDAFHEYIIHGDHQTLNPQRNGTKAAGHFHFSVPAHDKVEVRLRLSKGQNLQPFNNFDALFNMRRSEADDFYAELQTAMTNADDKLIQRQALAGMIWSKQFYTTTSPNG